MLHQTHSSLLLINMTLFCSLSLCEKEDSKIDKNGVSFAGSHEVMSLPFILLAYQNPLIAEQLYYCRLVLSFILQETQNA